jgi:Ran GTPase-activating protein (RanGAP) involved in mRNA processing and transport
VQLTELNLRDNRLLPWGAAALAVALRNSRSLAHLNLAENAIRDLGGVAVVDALATNESLYAQLKLACC